VESRGPRPPFEETEITSFEDDVVAILASKDYNPRQSLARLAVQHGSLLLSCERKEISLEELIISLAEKDSEEAKAG
jgi:hypothetical protein